MIKRKSNNNDFSKLEWGLFKNWDEMLEPVEGYKIEWGALDRLIEAIISICVTELRCDRKKFEKEFKKQNKEFYNFKRVVYSRYNWIENKSGNVSTFKRLLKVPANITIWRNDYGIC